MTVQKLYTPEKLIVIVGGPAGTGKSTVATSLSNHLKDNPIFQLADGTSARSSVQFIEGDELHPAANIAKMSAGIPLTDEDRMPWLKVLAETVVAMKPPAPTLSDSAQNFPGNSPSSENSSTAGPERPTERQIVICTCSCLKRKYRDYLRASIVDDKRAPSVRLAFVFLHASPEVLIARTMQRKDHFMKSEMVRSQIEAMEVPAGEELLGSGSEPGDAVPVGEKLQELGPKQLAHWLINKSRIF